jgi:hypothetical protein
MICQGLDEWIPYRLFTSSTFLPKGRSHWLQGLLLFKIV